MNLIPHCSEGSNELGNRCEEMDSVIDTTAASILRRSTKVLLALEGYLGNAVQLLLSDAQQCRALCRERLQSPARSLWLDLQDVGFRVTGHAGKQKRIHRAIPTLGAQADVTPTRAVRLTAIFRQTTPLACPIVGKDRRLPLTCPVPGRWIQHRAGLLVGWIHAAQQPRGSDRESVRPLQKFGVHLHLGLGRLLLGLPQRRRQVLQVEVPGRSRRAT
mmetsp:Transcript_16656/g.45080  ORF Transcript_16656/g.45080 Transcript_16656/m.45080 type:complete len:217 (-) Transcript_16656:2542-3192(-)